MLGVWLSMSNYEIKKVAENQYGLFDLEEENPEIPVVTCYEKPLLEKIKKDFILSDKAEKRRKPKK